MIDYATIDQDLARWAIAKKYTVHTRYRDDEVRALELWSSDHSQRAQIGVTDINDQSVELVVFDGKRKRKQLRAPRDQLTKLLDEAEALAKAWLGSK